MECSRGCKFYEGVVKFAVVPQVVGYEDVCDVAIGFEEIFEFVGLDVCGE